MKNLLRIPSHIRRRLSSNKFYIYLAVLGPGIIAANAGNDAGGIATYSTVGAAYGYTLLWVFIPDDRQPDNCAGNVRANGSCNRTGFG